MGIIKDSDFGIRDKRGHWSPFKKLTINPEYLLPFHFSKFLFKFIKDKFIFGFMGYIFIAMPILCWLFLSPDLDTVKNFEIGWILFIFIRNLAIILIFFGFFHLRLYTFNTQGNEFKYNPKPLDKNNKKFFLIIN